MTSVPSPVPHSAADAEPPAGAKPVPTLVLASASPARRKLLEDSHISFTVRVSEVDEDAVLAQAKRRASAALSPAVTASLLARAKATAVADALVAEGVSDALVLGCDSVFEFDGAAYGKPGTSQVARERITAMSGRTGTLHTGHHLVDVRSASVANPYTPDDQVHKLRSARVRFASMSPAEIDAYVATGEPLHVAGSFTLDGYGAAFIEGIDGEFHTVVGLSIHTLRSMLAARAVAVSDLWLPSAP